jgi:hypothetical protein
MFPGPGATIYRNEAGEVLGWDYPPDEGFFDYDDDEVARRDAYYEELADRAAEEWEEEEA